jgi:hypothetical protein
MNPHSVRFSQASISYRFADGTTIDDLAEALRTGKTPARGIPPLRLVERNGVYYTLDNRRLEAFRRAGVDIPWCLATPEEVRDEAWKFTTTNEGVSVRIRGQSS